MELNIKILDREEFKYSSPRSLRCSTSQTFDHLSPLSSPLSSPDTSPRSEVYPEGKNYKSPPLSPVSLTLLNYHKNKQ